MAIETIFGVIAFVTSVIGLFPQIHKAIKTKSTNDISMLMILNFTICSLAWMVYGADTRSIYVFASNLVGLISCIILIVLKRRYDVHA